MFDSIAFPIGSENILWNGLSSIRFRFNVRNMQVNFVRLTDHIDLHKQNIVDQNQIVFQLVPR